MEHALRVLLVEDDDFDQENVARMLPPPAFALESVSKLGQALERITAGKLDAVLLDVNLPDSQGSMTVRAAVSRAVGVPIVVLTGGDDDELGVEAMRVGAQDYIPKESLEEGLLRRVLIHAVERQRLLNDLSRRYAAWTTVVRSLRTLDTANLQKTSPAGFQELVGVGLCRPARTQHWDAPVGRRAHRDRRGDLAATRPGPRHRQRPARRPPGGDRPSRRLREPGRPVPRTGATPHPGTDGPPGHRLPTLRHGTRRPQPPRSGLRAREP